MINSDIKIFTLAATLMLIGLVFCGYVDIDYVRWNIIFYSIFHILLLYIFLFVRYVRSEKIVKRISLVFASLNIVYVINQIRFWNYNYKDYSASLNTNILIKISSIAAFSLILISLLLCLRKKR